MRSWPVQDASVGFIPGHALRLNFCLLDNNVVSELRRAQPHGAVAAWLGAILFLGVGLVVGSASAQQRDKRALTTIAGDLYRLQNNFSPSVFLVTREG